MTSASACAFFDPCLLRPGGDFDLAPVSFVQTSATFRMACADRLHT